MKNKVNKQNQEPQSKKQAEPLKNVKKKKPDQIKNTHPILKAITSLLIGIAYLIYAKNWLSSIIVVILSYLLLTLYFYLRRKIKIYNDIKRMELVFPDFIQLMASNLRAGITIDKALMLSSRKEFSPLDSEILKLGKDILTGKEIDKALLTMGQNINSHKINKTISLIITGIRSGGNLAVLLEETAVNLRERDFVEKRAASNVLMYTIFIFFAVAIGAPTLFGLSSVLVQILTNLFAKIPQVQSNIAIPLALTKISVSTTFINYFSVLFIIATNILASLILGLVSKGEEKEGLKYTLPLIALSLIIFFVVKKLLLNYFVGFF